MSDKDASASENVTLTDRVRSRFSGSLAPLARGLLRIGLKPNTITLLGLLGNTIGAVILAQGNFLVGGIVILIIGPVDALDGNMAREMGESSSFGAFVDSVTDRYSELVIFGGLIVYYASEANAVMVGLVFAAAAGSVLVSYVRARAEGLGYEAKVGILTRMERYVVLGPTLILGTFIPGIAEMGIAIIAILANVTAIQRVLSVRSQAHAEKG